MCKDVYLTMNGIKQFDVDKLLVNDIYVFLYYTNKDNIPIYNSQLQKI